MFTLIEAAAATNKNHSTVNQAVQRGQLNASRVGNQWMVSETDLQVWLHEYDPIAEQVFIKRMENE